MFCSGSATLVALSNDVKPVDTMTPLVGMGHDEPFQRDVNISARCVVVFTAPIASRPP
jgi:hypothetical protein